MSCFANPSCRRFLWVSAFMDERCFFFSRGVLGYGFPVFGGFNFSFLSRGLGPGF